MTSMTDPAFDVLSRNDPDCGDWRDGPQAEEACERVIAALPRRQYVRGLEVGGSVGRLSAALADRCDTLLSIDADEIAVQATRARKLRKSPVRRTRQAFPADLARHVPADGFDLILLSDTLRHLDRAALRLAAQTAWAIAAPDADVVMVHGLAAGNDDAVDRFITAMQPEARQLSWDRQPGYRIDVLRL